MHSKTVLLQVFFVLAFFLGHVSPVCAFISGNTQLLEICSADGTLKTIAVSGDFDPIQGEKKQQHAKAKDCAFCVFQSQLSKNPDVLHDVPLIRSVAAAILSAEVLPSNSLKYTQAQPRAPPSFF